MVLLTQAAVLLAACVAGSTTRRRLTSSYVRPAASEFIDPAKILANTACEAPPCSGQVHVTLGGAWDEAFVSYASASADTPSQVVYGHAPDALDSLATGTRVSYSQLMYFEDYILHPPTGLPAATEEELLGIEDTTEWANGTASWNDPQGTVSMGMRSYKNPQAYYQSPVLHHVTLSGLQPGQNVHYRIPNDDRVHRFRMPPASVLPDTPLTVGLVADLGQTAASNASIHFLLAEAPDVVLLAGDLSYADGFYRRWDSFGHLFEPLSSRVPVLTCGGNHEVGSSEQWLSYNARWRMPAEGSGSTDNTYWSKEIGAMHVIALNSYADTKAGSLQYDWLERALSRVDRARTPWLVVMMHAPFYCSNTGHVEETRLMRMDLERLLYSAGVDLVLNGHVHAYERTLSVYNFTLDECAPTYLTVGDGGNREGVYTPWAEPQPAWSLYRESSFGAAMLKVLNSTHAHYEWKRHSCQGSDDPTNINFNKSCESIAQGGLDNGQLEGSDEEMFVKPKACPNRWRSGSDPWPAPPQDATLDDNPSLPADGSYEGGAEAPSEEEEDAGDSDDSDDDKHKHQHAESTAMNAVLTVVYESPEKTAALLGLLLVLLFVSVLSNLMQFHAFCKLRRKVGVRGVTLGSTRNRYGNLEAAAAVESGAMMAAADTGTMMMPRYSSPQHDKHAATLTERAPAGVPRGVGQRTGTAVGYRAESEGTLTDY